MNQAKPDSNRHDAAVLILLVLVSGYYHLREIIHAKMDNPLFFIFLIGAGLLLYVGYLFVGHYFEKVLNKIRMWQNGIKNYADKNAISFPFIPFDLPAQLNRFYKDSKIQDCTFIGLDAENNRKEIISIPDAQRRQHMQILGMTGTGKTAGIFLPLIYQDALKNRPVIILDAKGGMESIHHLNAMLESIGRSEDFMLFSLSHKEMSCTYNPLYVGECDPQIIIDAFFNNFKDENTFYRETAKTIFTNVFYILHSLGKPFTPMDVYTYLTDEGCRQKINRQIKRTNKRGTLYLKLFNTTISRIVDQYKGWEHVITGFNNYLLNHKDDILNEDDSDIVLTEVIRQKKIVYFQLPTNAYPIQAVSIARMVQANLRYISSLIQTGQLPGDMLVSVIIDEYASFAEETFVEVLNKARSSGMMVTLAHQSLSDLTAISEPFMRRIDENTLNKIYLKQSDPELCELIARSLGTYTKEEKTYKMTGGRFGNQIHNGETSNKIVNEFHFAPDKIKNLHKFGQGYFVYRGDNTQRCVNLGCFPSIKGREYVKNIKPNKRQGLRLFEEYYLNCFKETKHLKNKTRLGSASTEDQGGVIVCDD